ncbi:hypothetical protein AB6A40_000365 [Gnathostoma spinigerum]|uniref:G-protein coupled receptors family 1 profile domain-containing protein n=1 Tax=Gnathostoma spinigerum TaxID=75299 RepID=A0ABD6E372_9BILA
MYSMQLLQHACCLKILFLIPLAVMVFLYGHIITTLNRGTRLDSSFIPLSHHRPFHVPTDFGRRLSSPVPRNSGRDPSMQSTTPPAQRASMSAIYAATLVVPMHFSRPRTSSLHVPGEEQQYRSLQPTSSRSIDCTCFLRSNNQDKALSAVKKANRMLIALVILFAICWMPSFVWWMFVRTGDLLNQRIWSDSVNTVITILTYISTCTNPLTYCFLNQSFRQSLIQHLSGATVLKAKRIRRPSTVFISFV